jgi:Glycosyl hydrolases family 28
MLLTKRRASHLPEEPALVATVFLLAAWEDAQIIQYLTLPSRPPLSRTLRTAFESRVSTFECIFLNHRIFHANRRSYVWKTYVLGSSSLTSPIAVYDATGSVSGVTYKDITLSSISNYGIVIEQDYENGSPTGTPTNGLPITDLVLDSVTGTVDSSGYNIYILCGSGSCSDWTWTDVDVAGGETSTGCENVHSGISCS